MSDKYKMQEIAEKCYLWYSDDDAYRIDDGFGEAVKLSPAEFNRLAMEAPLFRRVLDTAKKLKEEIDQLNLSEFNGKYKTPVIDDYNKLLAEIAELEKAG